MNKNGFKERYKIFEIDATQMIENIENIRKQMLWSRNRRRQITLQARQFKYRIEEKIKGETEKNSILQHIIKKIENLRNDLIIYAKKELQNVQKGKIIIFGAIGDIIVRNFILIKNYYMKCEQNHHILPA